MERVERRCSAGSIPVHFRYYLHEPMRDLSITRPRIVVYVGLPLPTGSIR